MNSSIFCNIATVQILIVMSHKVLQMEAKSLLEGVWETLSATSVTLGSNFLEIKTEPVNLMNSGQGVSQIVVVSAIAWVIIIYIRQLQLSTSDQKLYGSLILHFTI